MTVLSPSIYVDLNFSYSLYFKINLGSSCDFDNSSNTEASVEGAPLGVFLIIGYFISS